MAEKGTICIAAVNVTQGLVLLESNETVGIDLWLDGDGDECDRDDAVFCCGQYGGGWFTIDLRDFEERSVH